MNRLPRLIAPAAIVAALCALLFAATAAAEVRVGEATSPAKAGVPAEADILGASASYDSATGIATFVITTAAEPQAEVEGENSPYFTIAALGMPKAGACNAEEVSVPAMEMLSPYEEGLSYVLAAENEGENPFEEPATGSRSVIGTKTTLIGASRKTIGKGYTCALVGVSEGLGDAPIDELSFPIATYVPPTPAPTPQPAAAALSLGNAKSLKAKVGKWAKQKVTVTNTGGTAVASVAIKASASKGVTVRPGTTKLAALLPGQSWTFTVDVKLSATAAKKSTVSLTTSAGALSAKGSFAVTQAGS